MRFLRNMSGFGWDDERKMVTATVDVWEVLKDVRTVVSLLIISANVAIMP